MLSAVGCTGIIKPAQTGKETEAPAPTAETTEAPSEEPTEEPPEEPTEEPSEEPTEDPSEEPTEAPSSELPSYYFALAAGNEYEADIDLDGETDSIVITREPADEYEDKYTFTVTRACAPDAPFVYVITYCYDMVAWLVDCDTADRTLDLIISFAQDSDDWTSAAIRMNADGSELTVFETYRGIYTIDESFSGETGFSAYTRCDVLGTYDLEARFTVDGTGFVLIFPEYLYPNPDNGYTALTLIREMDVTVLDKHGEPSETRTLPVGDTIAPAATDMSSFVMLKLSDGTLAVVELKISSGDDWGIYINGVDQDEYALIPYAD